MTNADCPARGPRPYLLVPMPPTPNGRLHVGHGAGPYLRSDAVARSLRRRGHAVRVITGSDSYENWVLADALRAGRTPAETCAEFHTGIDADLCWLDIDRAVWIDPLHPDHSQAYARIHERILAECRSAGAATFDTESIPYGARTGWPLTGTFLAGRCPHCARPCGGNTCTGCGAHFQPDQIHEPAARLTHESLMWRTRRNWFLTVRGDVQARALRRDIVGCGVPASLMDPIDAHLTDPVARIRLSHSGEWGIHSDHTPAGTVLSNTYYAYSVYAAAVYAATSGLDGTALDRGTETCVVGFFGTDNSVAGILAPHVIAAATARFRPLDTVVVTHMLHVGGQKCSTSRRHGVWLRDVAARTTITSDELRLILAQAPLERSVVDLTTARMTETVNWWRHQLRQRLEPALESADGAPASRLVRQSIERTDAQDRHLTPPTVDLSAATGILLDWMTDPTPDLRDPSQAGAWLLGVALLSWPVTPRLAHRLWAVLGHHAAPAVADVVRQGPLRPSALDVVWPGDLDEITSQELDRIMNTAPSVMPASHPPFDPPRFEP